MARDGSQCDTWICVNSALETADECVVEFSVQTAQPARLVGFLQFRDAMKNGVDQNYIRVDAVNPGREHDLRPFSRATFLPPTCESIQKKPSEKLNEMGPGKRADTMPINSPDAVCSRRGFVFKVYVAKALRVKFDLIFVIRRKVIH